MESICGLWAFASCGRPECPVGQAPRFDACHCSLGGLVYRLLYFWVFRPKKRCSPGLKNRHLTLCLPSSCLLTCCPLISDLPVLRSLWRRRMTSDLRRCHSLFAASSSQEKFLKQDPGHCPSEMVLTQFHGVRMLEKRRAGKAVSVNQGTDVSRLRLPNASCQGRRRSATARAAESGGKKVFALVTGGGFLRKEWQRAKGLKNRQGK